MKVREFPLLFAIFLDLAGFGMAFPDIQLRAEKFGAPGWLIGLLLASYFVTQFVASPLWGALSDRVGRKPILLVCTALSALSMLIYAFAQGVGLILASRLLAGLAAANVVVAQAYLSDVTQEAERKASMGRISAAILLGLVSGPAIGGELAARGGNLLMGLTACGASTLSLLWILFGVRAIAPRAKVPEARAGKRHGFAVLGESATVRNLFVVYAAGWFSLACLEGTFGRLIKRMFGFGQREFGYVFAYESLLGAFTGLFLAWLTRRSRTSTTLRIGYSLQGIGLGLNPLAPAVAAGMAFLGLAHGGAAALAALLAASTLYAFGSGVANPTVMTAASLAVPEHRQGELFGVLQAARSAGFFIGPIVGGALFDVSSMAPYAIAAAVSLLAALLVRVPEGEGKDSEAGPGP